MWKDPVDTTKRRPRRLRGTPANKVVNILAFSVVAVFSAPFWWYSNSTLAWVLRAKERVLKRIEPKPREEIRREMYKDPVSIRVYEALNDRADARAAGESPDKRRIEEFVAFNG